MVVNLPDYTQILFLSLTVLMRVEYYFQRQISSKYSFGTCKHPRVLFVLDKHSEHDFGDTYFQNLTV
jgi:ABC-type microcin C transport system permease subunit YejB